jgi:transposase-like protein
MKRLTAVDRVRKELEELMKGGDRHEPKEDFGVQFMQLAIRRLMQELLEAERTEYLGRDRYERKPDTGRRNGYEDKTLRTSVGNVPVEVPQVRDAPGPFRSALLGQLGVRSDVLERLAVEMYARGLSTRDIDDALAAATGEQVLSRSTVSEITEALWAEFDEFQQRDLSEYELECLFLDAIYESLRLQGGRKEAVLCAWGILRDGRKILLHLALGNKENLDAWLDILRNMVERGLRLPVSVTSDGAPGLVRAIDQVYPKSLRVRCWAHKMRNIEAKLPAEAVAEVRAEIVTVRDAATFEQGRARAEAVISKYEGLYPSAMACLGDDLEASLNHLKLPVQLRKLVRTTNLLERTFEEERRRTKVIPRFFSEKSCLKLSFAVLWRASARWARVSFKPRELEQLDTLRAALKLVSRQDVEARPQPGQMRHSA